MQIRIWALVSVLLFGVARARADAALLLEEPYGTFGNVNPTGHAAIYLTRVCAVSPTQLRRCQPNESGVVISRYHKIAGYDWIAIPVLPYLYAVDSLSQVPKSADPALVAEFRNSYRRAHLLSLAPDETDGTAPHGEWTQLIGSAYDRRIYGFLISTTPAQDDALIARLNSRSNKSHFNLLFRNCADFAKSIVNFYYPHAVRRNLFADAGITTPKQVAKSLARRTRHQPDLSYSTFVIEQIPGDLPRSQHVDGVLEALLKSKKYVVPLALLHPALTGSFAVAYFSEGRFDPRKDAVDFNLAHTLVPPASSAAAPVIRHRVSGNG